jgi:hypothetical protein
MDDRMRDRLFLHRLRGLVLREPRVLNRLPHTTDADELPPQATAPAFLEQLAERRRQQRSRPPG